MVFGNNGRHVKGSANGSASLLGKLGLSSEFTGLSRSGIETGKGDNLANGGEVGHGTKLGKEFANRECADALNRDQEVSLIFEVRMLVEVIVDVFFDLLDLLT